MPEKKRIFVADDEEVALTSLKGLLTISGFDVDATGDPKKIMPMVKAFKPHLIILDLLMPNMGGFEIFELLNSDKDTQAIPIIVTSALGDMPDIKRAYRLGAVGYFTKPYDFKELLKEINKSIAFKEGGPS